jgi:ligand-binding SRPBCC domain-containing protein
MPVFHGGTRRSNRPSEWRLRVGDGPIEARLEKAPTIDRMPLIEFHMLVHAPITRVFDLSRSVDLHLDSTGETREIVVEGPSSGLLGLGDEITWEATHLYVRQRLTSRITGFDRPHSFRDSMVRGAFRRFDHDHLFEESNGATTVRERFDFDAPLWVLGRLAETLFLERYMRRFLLERTRMIKTIAESDDWARYVDPG